MHCFRLPKYVPPPTNFIKVENYEDNGHYYRWGCQCPKCGQYHEFTHGETWKYCPKCGQQVN